MDRLALGNIDLTTDDRLNVSLAGFVEEIRRSKKVAVVGNGHGGHFLARRFIQQFGGLTSSVEQAVIRMNVKMNELRLAHGTPF